MEIIKSKGLLSKRQQKTHDLLLKWLLNHLSAATRSNYEQVLREFGNFLDSRRIKISHPKEISSLMVIAYRDFLKHQAPKTIARKLSCLSSVFQELVFAQEMKTNPVSSVKRLKAQTVKQKSFFEDSEIEQLLGLFPDESKLFQLQNRTLLCLLAESGQRITSILRLKKKDVSMMGDVPVIQITVKGGTKKLLPVPDQAARLLLKLIAHRTIEEDFVFQATRGKKTINQPITRQAAHLLLKNSLRRINANPNRSLHSMRRSLITKALENEVPLDRVQNMIAFHANPQTTLIYKKDAEFRLENHPLLDLFKTKKRD